MNLWKISGIVLLVVGVILLVYGFTATDSLVDSKLPRLSPGATLTTPWLIWWVGLLRQWPGCC